MGPLLRSGPAAGGSRKGPTVNERARPDATFHPG